MMGNSFFKLLSNFGAKILRDKDFVHFCARYKNPVHGLTWEVSVIKFGGLGTCVFKRSRGVCVLLVGMGT